MHDIPSWVWIVGILIAAPKLYYILQVGRRKKDDLGFRTRRAAIALLCYVGGFLVLNKMGYRPLESLAFSFFFGIAIGFIFVKPPKRSRIIPAHIKRAVIERDLKGERFDSRLHHLDHIVLYSKGGDNSVRNLRVIPKTDNLRRGARMPRLRDFR
jgi:hypothetical protein